MMPDDPRLSIFLAALDRLEIDLFAFARKRQDK